MVNLVVIETYEKFLALSSEWNALLNNPLLDHTVFSTHEWLCVWLNHFGKDRKILVLLAYDEDTLVGIAPLMSSNKKLRGCNVRCIGFIENSNSLHNDFVVLPQRRKETINAFINWLINNQERWDIIELINMPMDSENTVMIQSIIHDYNLLRGSYPGYTSPYIEINSDWDSYYKSLSSKARKTLRNISNRMEKEGTCSLQCIRTHDEYRAKEHHILDIAKNSWTEKVGDSLASGGNLPFFRELSAKAAQKNWLMVWLLSLDEKYVAYEYHLIYRKVLYGMRTSFDDEYSRVSPGAYLDFRIVRSLFEKKIDVEGYDLGGSYDFYKKKWTDCKKQNINLKIFNKSLKLRALYCLENIIIPKIKKFKYLGSNLLKDRITVKGGPPRKNDENTVTNIRV